MKMKTLTAVAAMAFALSARSETPQTLYGDWSGTLKWTDAAGQETAWTDGSVARIMSLANRNNKNDSPLSMYGLVVDCEAQVGFWSDGARITIGAGGVIFTRNGTFAVGRADFGEKRLAIASDQTWRGPSSGGYANFSVGWGGFFDYWRMPLEVGADVSSLTMGGNLNVWLLSPSNDLSSVDVTLQAPAHLYLPADYTVSSAARHSDAHLRARTLTLDGAEFSIGETVTYYYGSVRMALVSDLDADHVASTLVLKDGARVVATGDCTLAVPTLRAVGMGNLVSGTFAVTQAKTSLEIADGASLAFAGSLTERGVEASLDVSGAGGLTLPCTTALTGGIYLGKDISLTFAGGGMFSCPIRGGKELVSDAPGATNALTAAALAGFTGSRIFVRRGALLLVGNRPFGVEIEVSEGAELVESGDWIVTDIARTEAELVVGVGRTLEVFGNGLTAATEIILDGGTLAFAHAATVSSPIKVRQKSWIATAALAVTGTVAGVVDCAITNLTKGLWITGDGCVKFAGGATFAGDASNQNDADTLCVGQGSVFLTNGGYDFGWGGIEVVDPDAADESWGRYVGVCDGGDVTFADAGNAMGQSRVVIGLYPKVDGSYYAAEATFVVGEGGRVTLPWNSQVQLGNNQNVGRLVIDGGEWRVNGKHHKVYLTGSKGGYVTGVLEVKAGLMEISEPLYRGNATGQGRVIWSGGTLRPTKGFLADKGQSLYTKPLSGYSDGGALRTWVQVAGDGCVLDLTDYPHETFDGVPVSGCDRSEWFGTGTLTVRGGKTFRMPSFPAGISLLLDGEGSIIEVPADAKVFDNDRCLANAVAKPYPLNAYSSADAEISGSLAVDTLVVTNGAACFVNRLADVRTTVAKVDVRTEGVWDNATTLTGADVAVTDMAFGEGAVLRAQVKGLCTPSLTLAGTLALPKTAVFRAVRNSSLAEMSSIVLRAEGGIFGETAWSCRPGPRPEVKDAELFLTLMGLCVTIR